MDVLALFGDDAKLLVAARGPDYETKEQIDGHERLTEGRGSRPLKSAILRALDKKRKVEAIKKARSPSSVHMPGAGTASGRASKVNAFRAAVELKQAEVQPESEATQASDEERPEEADGGGGSQGESKGVQFFSVAGEHDATEVGDTPLRH